MTIVFKRKVISTFQVLSKKLNPLSILCPSWLLNVIGIIVFVDKQNTSQRTYYKKTLVHEGKFPEAFSSTYVLTFNLHRTWNFWTYINKDYTYTVFLRIVSAETIVFWIWPYLLWPFALCIMTFGFPNSKNNSFRGNYMRKYGIFQFKKMVIFTRAGLL